MIHTWEHNHIVHLGGRTETPPDPASDMATWRKKIEPWLSAVFQSEHLSLLLGNGFTTAIVTAAGGQPVNMALEQLQCPHSEKVIHRAETMAKAMGRGAANIEDQLSAALALLAGLQILEDPHAAAWEKAIDDALSGLMKQVLAAERCVANGLDNGSPTVRELLVSFLMSFASRTASRERLHLFTTNYDRLIERGCDLAGLRTIDRFVGAVEPEFRSSRLQVDMHYTPPGIRGEPRHLEGVIHFTKLHGSADWRCRSRRICRTCLPFGADEHHPAFPKSPRESLVIYPNSVKDIETAAYPYADLFRDFSAAICQPNSVLVTYGYGYGDDHVNRIIADMLTIPSTHLVMIAWSRPPHERIASFVSSVGRPQQLTLLVGDHFGDIHNLVAHYLPKPAIDPLTIRMAELLERRGTMAQDEPPDSGMTT